MRTGTTALVAVAALCGSASLAPTTEAYERFCSKLPNGNSAFVKKLQALGHTNHKGGAPLNAFGRGFKRSGKLWTEKFCKEDSDGDGQTNGQELGDPCCSWVETGNLAYVRGLSDPTDPKSRTNPKMYRYIQCTKSEEAVAAAEKLAKKSKKPKKTDAPATEAPDDQYDDGEEESGSGSGPSEDEVGHETGASSTLSSAVPAALCAVLAWAVLL